MQLQQIGGRNNQRIHTMTAMKKCVNGWHLKPQNNLVYEVSSSQQASQYNEQEIFERKDADDYAIENNRVNIYENGFYLLSSRSDTLSFLISLQPSSGPKLANTSARRPSVTLECMLPTYLHVILLG